LWLITVISFVVLGVVAMHFERPRNWLRRQRSLAEQVAPNIGELAYDGGGRASPNSISGMALHLPSGCEIAHNPATMGR
jgi:hypothetical protein